MRVTVHHWQYNPVGSSKQGWFCWAYPSDDREFEKWMKANCPTADWTHRFNSGDPMYTVLITNNEEATSFKLQWD